MTRERERLIERLATHFYEQRMGMVFASWASFENEDATERDACIAAATKAVDALNLVALDPVLLAKVKAARSAHNAMGSSRVGAPFTRIMDAQTLLVNDVFKQLPRAE